MLYVLCDNLLESSSCAVIEEYHLWSHHSYIVWSCDCLIIYSDRKSDDHTINNSDDNDVVIKVSIREEEDNRENIIREENKNRKNRKKDRILSDSLKEVEREKNIVLINRKICWDNSTDNESIN